MKLIIFDMAGTTVHDEDFVNLCLQDALHGQGLNASREEINEVMGLPKPEAIETVLKKHFGHASQEQIEFVHAEFLEKMITFYAKDERVKEVEGASDVFQTLRRNGILVGLDTGFSRPIADRIIERLGWSDMIDVSVTSDEVANGRPHPDMTLKVMELTGIVDASLVAKVGDTISDLGEGTAAGCGMVIGVLTGAYTREELEKGPHTHILESIREIPALMIGSKA